MLGVVCVLLFISNYKFMQILIKADPSDKKMKEIRKLKCYTAIFTFSFALRAVFSVAYGSFNNVLPNFYVRMNAALGLEIVWDLPLIILLLAVDYMSLKRNEEYLSRVVTYRTLSS